MKINMKGNKRAEVLLYEDIGGWFGVNANEFVKEIKSLGNVDTINLRINSNGGNVFDGVTMYNYLKSHSARIEIDIDGIAASIASIIAMSGDEIRIADNAWLMIHDPWIMAMGTADELRTAADTMDGIRETLLDTYMHRTTVSRQEMSDMMSAETWINANDALEYGLVDSVTGALSVAASLHKDWFKNPPKSLVDRTKANKNVKLIQSRIAQRIAAQNLSISRPGANKPTAKR